MSLIQEITVDLVPSFIQMPVVYCSQYDDNIRQVSLTVMDNGTAFNVTSYDIYIEGTKPDKHGFSYPLSEVGTASGNNVTFSIQLQMCAVPGMTRMELVLRSGDNRVGTANFMLAVERAGLQDDTNTSDSELAPYIDGAQAAMRRAEAAADEAEDHVEDAEAWAIGKRNGQDVESDDETYHNNSKYYADQVADEVTGFQAEIDALDDRIDGINLSYYETTNPITHAKTEVGISLAKDGQYSDVAIWGTNSTIPEATTSKNGWMSAQDKTDLSNAKSNITTLQNKVSTLEGEMDTAQDDLSDLLSAFEQLPTSIQPDMTVGSLMSEEYTEEKMPYLYRVSGGGIEVGKVEADEIVGGTIAWNQMIERYRSTATVNGITFTNNGDSISISGTITTAFSYNTIPLTPEVPMKRDGTKYLILLSQRLPHKVGISGFGTFYTLNSDGFIWTNTAGGTWNGSIAFINTEVGQTFNVSNLRFSMINLTQLFGTTIADHLYSLEQSTTGAGVAWFRKLFPKDYYEYNAGELLSVSGLQSHDMVGFNLFNADAVTPNAWLSTSTGLIEISPSTAGYCVSDYIRVFKGQTVHIPGLGSVRRWFYDMDKNPSVYMQSALAQLYTPLSDGYIRVTIKKDEYPLDTICINLSSDKNGTYEPYKSYTYPLDSSLILRGIPELDASNNLYYDGDVYSADGKVTRKYGVITLSGGSEATYVKNGASAITSRAFVNITGKAFGYSNFISDKFIVGVVGDVPYSAKGRPALSGIEFYLPPTVEQDDNAIKAWFASNPTTVVYELATPTEETAEPYEEYQHVIDGGTEEYVSTGIVPVGHITKYYGDIGSKVDKLPSDFSNIIAPTETGFKATRAYTVNELIIIDNVLYKVTASIASGATITPNTNVQQTTLSALIKALSA